jgi:type III secretion protein R
VKAGLGKATANATARVKAAFQGPSVRGGLRRTASLATALAIVAWPALALAAPTPPKGAAAGADDLLARPLALVVALALVSLLPFFLMVTTSFVKASTTLQIVRSAIGAQGVPSNTVVMALAAALALMTMAPVIDAISERARPLWQAERAPDTTALVTGIVEAVREPMRAFLRANASAQERARFVEVARRARPEAERGRVGEDDLVVLVPAFLTTELYEAFLLGFAIFLPFLVVDLVVANVLLALGMQQLQPTQVSLPFKLFLFVAVDGWGLLAQALVAGYKTG